MSRRGKRYPDHLEWLEDLNSPRGHIAGAENRKFERINDPKEITRENLLERPGGSATQCYFGARKSGKLLSQKGQAFVTICDKMARQIFSGKKPRVNRKSVVILHGSRAR